MKRNISDIQGFTLVELVLVILLIGILSAYIAPRFELASFRDDTEASLFLSNLRYAQHRAMVTGGGWNLTFSGTSYSLADETGAPQNFPDGRSTVNVTAITSTRSPLYFDYLGTPDNDTTGSNINEVSTQTLIIIGGQTFTIEPNTGGIL